MVLLNTWVLFCLIPLFLLYKKHTKDSSSRQINFLYLALLFMFFALARPALQNAITHEKFHSQEYIIALDASYSMQADDLKPSRYEMAKEAIKHLILTHPKDRFTLLAFTSNALLISPPTTDSDISIQALDSLNPNYILTKSTSLLNLFKTVAKMSFQKKNLIVFSDGGDESNLEELVNILKKNSITPYIVATATKEGAALKKDGGYIKDTHSALVVSKINPILKDLASLSGGKYYKFTSPNSINSLTSDIKKIQKDNSAKIEVKSYKELFYFPLFIAIVLYFISITKLHQMFIFIPLLFIPHPANAEVFDFYHIVQASKHFKLHKYRQAAIDFEKVEPSVQSYYNIAVSYYKDGAYKYALKYFSQIQTSNKNIKQAIYYNMGNSAYKIKKYNKAQEYYIKALALGRDNDAIYNLNLIRKLHLKSVKDVQKMMLHKQNQTKPKASKQSSKKKSESESQHKKSSSSKKSGAGSKGSGGSKKQKQSVAMTKKKSKKTNNYKMGYKAYEIINKGYADEKEPW